MHFVPIAPYDPIFWFHHNNVERQFELWQLMNPDKWLEPSKSVTPVNTMSVVIDEVRRCLPVLCSLYGMNDFWLTS